MVSISSFSTNNFDRRSQSDSCDRLSYLFVDSPNTHTNTHQYIVYSLEHIWNTYNRRSQVIACHMYLLKNACDRLSYGVATISTLIKIIGLFCRISSLLKGSFAKETYDFEEPTTHSHPIASCVKRYI